MSSISPRRPITPKLDPKNRTTQSKSPAP